MMTAKSQQFLNELALFYRNRGQHSITANNLIVRLNGKPVNLYELYSSVVELGGSYKVNQQNRWDDLYLKLFRPQPLGANVSVALRQIYQKYLLAYERINYSNFISDTMDDDDENPNKDFNSNYSLTSSNHLALNHHHHNHHSNINPLNKLFCSMTSDLPNEMDFGLRVATILTNSEKIDSLADFKFIDIIIECCILYICSCERMDYSKSTDYQFEDDELINLLIREELRHPSSSEQQSQPQQSKSDGSIVLIDDQQKENVCDRTSNNRSVSSKFTVNNVRKFVPFKDCKCFLKFWSQMMDDKQDLMKFVFDLTDDELVQLADSNYCQQEHQKNYYKIKRIVCLLKNVSYSIEKLRQEQQTYESEDYDRIFGNIADNASINLLRLFILLLNSDDQFLINIALEIMSNVSPLLNSSSMCTTDQSTYVQLLTSIYDWCVQKVLYCSDVNCLNRCIEILTKLINANHIAINRLIISDLLSQTTSFFNRLTELLTCQHDVGAMVSTLECCLVLSENYPKLLLNDNKHLIKMLINLINCEEAQFFTLSSIKKVNIIDERRIEYHQTNVQHQRTQSQQQTILIQQPANQVNQKSAQLNELNNNSAILADNEQHVKNWFYATFDSKPMNTASRNVLKLNEMYGDYVKHSCVNGRRNVVTSQTFGNLLKKYFPNVSINLNEVDGLSIKSNINRLTSNKISIVQTSTNLQIATNTTDAIMPNNLTSPILKAHLSTPPKSTNSNQVNNPSIINSNNQQTRQIVNGPITATTTSTASPLIKNLLANKLRNNQNTLNNTNQEDTKPVNLLQQSNITLVTNQQIDQSKSQSTCIVKQPNVSTGNIIFTTNATTTMSNGVACGSNLITVKQPIVSTGNIIFTTNPSTTMSNGVANGSNLIAVQQHIVPVSSSSNVIINANQLTNQTGTMVLQQPNNVAGSQQQFLLVRTILPSQNNTTNPIVGNTGVNQQPMRLILPASVLTTQSPQTVTINGAPSTIFSQAPGSNLTNNNMIDNSQPTNDANTCGEKDKLLKAFLESTPSAGNQQTPAPLTNNISSSPEQKSVPNNVKSSPLLNVLLDKGKLPEFSTVSNDMNTEETNTQPTVVSTANSPTTVLKAQSTTNQIASTAEPLTNHIHLSSTNSSSTTDVQEKPCVLTNGCLEKEKDDPMQIEENYDKEDKKSLLKRQLENDDTLCKRPKVDSTITSVQQTQQIITATVSESQEPVSINSQTIVNSSKPVEIKISVSSNGILPTQPTISNTFIKTALNSSSSPLSKQILSTTPTCTIIEKIPVVKPNVIISNNVDQQKILSTKTIKVVTAPIQTAQLRIASKIEYICEWSNCKKSFDKPQGVFLHVHKDHIISLPDTQTMKCSWGSPEGTGPGCKSLRPKYSLLTHLQDFHCGVQQLQQAARRNQQLATKGVTDVPQIVPPAHPGYANNAAFMAIKRHSTTNLIETRPVANISPLSKSVRLTAAMILRNLAQHSNTIKSLLKNYESYLSELCIFDNREDSRTLAQCLAVIAQEKV